MFEFVPRLAGNLEDRSRHSVELGGIGSIPGAMLGGLVLGVAEAFGADVFGDQYKDVVAFGLLVLVLLFRPTGILGRPEVEKV